MSSSEREEAVLTTVFQLQEKVRMLEVFANAESGRLRQMEDRVRAMQNQLDVQATNLSGHTRRLADVEGQQHWDGRELSWWRQWYRRWRALLHSLAETAGLLPPRAETMSLGA